MKKYILTLAVALIGLGSIIAQDINEQETRMSLGKQNSFTVDIEGADAGVAAKVWKKFAKDYGKVKRNKKAKEFYTKDATVSMVAGADRMDLYIKFDERVGQATATLWIDYEGAFVNSNEHPAEAQGAEELLQNFYVDVRAYVINEEMKAQEKELKKLDKGLRKPEKQNTGYHQDIEKAKERIEKAEKNIEQNLKDQDDQRISIEQQKKVIEDIIERLNNLKKG